VSSTRATRGRLVLLNGGLASGEMLLTGHLSSQPDCQHSSPTRAVCVRAFNYALLPDSRHQSCNMNGGSRVTPYRYHCMQYSGHWLYPVDPDTASWQPGFPTSCEVRNFFSVANMIDLSRHVVIDLSGWQLVGKVKKLRTCSQLVGN